MNYNTGINIKKKEQGVIEIKLDPEAKKREKEQQYADVAVDVSNLVLIADIFESSAMALDEKLKKYNFNLNRNFYLKEIRRYSKFMVQGAMKQFDKKGNELHGDTADFITECLPYLKLIIDNETQLKAVTSLQLLATESIKKRKKEMEEDYDVSISD